MLRLELFIHEKTNEPMYNAMLNVKEEKNISNDHPIDCWRVIGVGHRSAQNSKHIFIAVTVP